MLFRSRGVCTDIDDLDDSLTQLGPYRHRVRQHIPEVFRVDGVRQEKAGSSDSAMCEEKKRAMDDLRRLPPNLLRHVMYLRHVRARTVPWYGILRIIILKICGTYNYTPLRYMHWSSLSSDWYLMIDDL